MLGIIIGTILCVIVMSLGIIMYINDDCSIVGMLLSTFGGIGVLIFTIFIGVYGFEWKASEVKAKLVNKEYGTSYTKEEVFYAEDVIETIQEIKRTRLDIQ
ncbi:MAG: hypothetical protein PF569_01330 [Candidatus Woesearchaeota archaeon]|jgi:hypothetical protein|nr:hypothetical protein [Candidatus Woesearchaeota archaeon]